MGGVLGIVYRCIATHLIKKAGFTLKTAQTGAVTLIQRFGSALNQCSLCCALMHECRGRMDAQERPTCCSSTGCTSSVLTARCGSAG
jgi:hypothetical protein